MKHSTIWLQSTRLAALTLSTGLLMSCGSLRSSQHKTTSSTAQEESVSAQKIEAPAPIYPIPTADQLAWQKLEQYAFIHFGLNTFNDLEWGFGDTPPETFNPKNMDAEQWVRIIKAAGFKGIILTAKHHDGFCLWPTKTTEYSIKNSPWKNGKGDIVKDLSDACHKHGLKFGIYLSPWDRHHPRYAYPEYVETFHAQMHELLSNYGPIFEYWFDGANGGDGWYGGANEKRQIDATTYYRYEEAREYIKKLHPQAMIFGGTCPDIRWIGNERGYAGMTNWSAKTIGSPGFKMNMVGQEDGKDWLPGECDVSIRPGWFFHHREDHQVKTPAKLMDIYYGSVGRNANLLLNFPVDMTGRIAAPDSTAIMDWKHLLDEEFSHPVLQGSRVEASATRANEWKAENVLNDDYDSYWSVPDNNKEATITFYFDQPKQFNRLMLQEYIPLGQRVRAFQVLVLVNGQWTPVEMEDETTTIGYKRLLRFPTVNSKGLRIHFSDAKGPICINRLEAYLAPAIVSTLPELKRDANNNVSIVVLAPNLDIYYSTDGSNPTPQTAKKYEAPFAIEDGCTVKAIAYDPVFEKSGAVVSQEFGLAPKEQKLKGGQKEEDLLNLTDGDPATVVVFPKGQNSFEIVLDRPQLIYGFEMMPNQGRDARGHIHTYALYIDGKLVKEGEFSNIKNNPILQRVEFSPVTGRRIELKAKSIVDNRPYIQLSDFMILIKKQ